MQCACISANDSYPALRSTLEFIQAHQISKEGVLVKTSFFISFALQDDDVIGSGEARQLAQFVLYGAVAHITETTVQLTEVSICEHYYDVYTLSLGAIVTLYHDALATYAQAYDAALMTLPPLCCDVEYTIIPAFHRALARCQESKDIQITVIYGQISSLKYLPSQFKIIGNILIVTQAYVIPFSQIQGFFEEPLCLAASGGSVPEGGRLSC